LTVGHDALAPLDPLEEFILGEGFLYWLCAPVRKRSTGVV
jgi:hypothetical protein